MIYLNLALKSPNYRYVTDILALSLGRLNVMLGT